ncbi:hypothetical protein GQ53DRAFT_843143 [Thozetella sp. PMI_491]|nr:hypothetical protein GQ53DRAFT_843143 [Thozetella sp. PMI_491]
MTELLDVFYPLAKPGRVRDRPMQVLALGLPRTGTDSLREALEKLGYDHVYHGFDCIMSVQDCRAWTELYSKRDSGQAITAEDLDTILGQSRAITDHPCCLFGPELIDAYPDAKVIVNHRSDVDAWYRSLMAVLPIIDGMSSYFRSWVDSEEYWGYEFIRRGFRKYFRNDVPGAAKAVYEEHYARIRAKLKPGQYLEWTVEDGWEPLCKYLGKPVPVEPFPFGNAPPEFLSKAGVMMGERRRRATTRLTLLSGVVVAGLAAASYYVYN